MKKLLALLFLLALPALATAQEFVPLTGLPGLEGIASAGGGSLPDFFNALYRICIGAAAVIAVFQIMRAGVLSMLNEGSVIQKGKVRSMITQSILGLALVLSPALVFGIIDPRILNLELNLESLRPDDAGAFVVGGLTQEEVDIVTSQAAEAAGACGMTWTEQEADCVMDNLRDSAAAQACVPAMTAQQRQCFAQEITRRSQEVPDHVEGDLHSYTTTPDSYITLAIGATSDRSCRSLLGNAYATASACQAALPEFQQTVAGYGNGWTVLYSCHQVNSRGEYAVRGENMCLTQPSRP